MKKVLGMGALALSLATMAGCTVRSYHRHGPPPPPYDAMGARYEHNDRVWIPGYNRWMRNRWVWVDGRWAKPPRRGMAWVPGYRERRGGVYIWIEGRWR